MRRIPKVLRLASKVSVKARVSAPPYLVFKRYQHAPTEDESREKLENYADQHAEYFRDESQEEVDEVLAQIGFNQDVKLLQPGVVGALVDESRDDITTGDEEYDEIRFDRRLGEYIVDEDYDTLTPWERAEVQEIMKKIYGDTIPLTGKSPYEKHSSKEEIEDYLIHQISNTEDLEDTEQALPIEYTEDYIEYLDAYDTEDPQDNPVIMDHAFEKENMISYFRELGGHRPHLREKVRWEMFLLHKLDPKKWTDIRLAIKYGMRRPRVAAILKFKQIELEYSKTDIWRGTILPNDDKYDELFEDYGLVTRAPDRLRLPGKRPSNEFLNEGYTDEDADHAVMSKAWRRGRSLRWQPPEELPPEPPQEVSKIDPPTFVDEIHPYHKPERQMTLIAMDSKVHRKKLNDATRLIVRFNPDGTRSNVPWKERRNRLPFFQFPYLQGTRPIEEFKTDFSEEERIAEEIEKARHSLEEQGSVPHLLRKLGYHVDDDEWKIVEDKDPPPLELTQDEVKQRMVDREVQLDEDSIDDPEEESQEVALNELEGEPIDPQPSIEDESFDPQSSIDNEPIDYQSLLADELKIGNREAVNMFHPAEIIESHEKPIELDELMRGYPEQNEGMLTETVEAEPFAWQVDDILKDLPPLDDEGTQEIDPADDILRTFAGKRYMRDLAGREKKIASYEENFEGRVEAEITRRMGERLQHRKKIRKNEELSDDAKEAYEKRWAAQDAQIKQDSRNAVKDNLRKAKSQLNASKLMMLEDHKLTSAQQQMKDDLTRLSTAWKTVTSDDSGVRHEVNEMIYGIEREKRVKKLKSAARRMNIKYKAQFQKKLQERIAAGEESPVAMRRRLRRIQKGKDSRQKYLDAVSFPNPKRDQKKAVAQAKKDKSSQPAPTTQKEETPDKKTPEEKKTKKQK